MTDHRASCGRRGLGAGATGTDAGTTSATQATQVRYAAADLSLVAALIHAWAIPEHFGEWWGYGIFFLVVAVAQAYLSDGLLYRPRPRLFLAGIAGNLAVVALYVATRSVGIPVFGPHAGEVEPVGAIDLASVLAEVALIAALVALSRFSSPVESPMMRRAHPAGGLPEENVER
ncbi:MAG: hypothetical protein M3P51_05725 [Chloroflexota bacterium]|nr:hypothetical protein [Chloroflexota bacterium]